MDVNARIKELTGGQYIGMAALAAEVEKEPEPMTTGDLVMGGIEGMTFGRAGELAGLAAAVVPGGEDFAGARELVEEDLSRFKEEHPIAGYGSEIYGGLAMPVGGGAKLATSMMRPGMGLLGRMGAAAVAGGGTGLLAGALQGGGMSEPMPWEDPGQYARDVAAGGAIGGGLGAAVGGVLPAIGAGAGKAGRFARELIGPEGAARSEAGRTLRRTLEAAGLTPDEVAAELERLGPHATIADVDPVLAREARAASNQAPSLGRSGGPVEGIAARQEARGDRMARAMREAAGISETYDDAYKASEAAVDAVRKQHYQPLEQMYTAVDDAGVARMLNDPGISPFVRRVAKEVYDGKRLPNFRELQEIRGYVEDAFLSAKRAGRVNRSGTYRQYLNDLTDAMEDAMPGYRAANAAYRDAQSTLKSFKRGYDMWNKPAREQASAIAELKPDAQEAFRIGLLTRWEEALTTREGGGAAAGRLMAAGDEVKAQLLQLFGGEDGLNMFLRTRDIEGAFAVTSNWLRGNSTTAMQLSDALESAPMSRSALLNRVWNALFSPGEARRLQAEQVGGLLMSRDVDRLRDAAQQGLLYRGATQGARGAPGGIGLMGSRVAGRQGPNVGEQY
jgi:hypothetical protein